MQAPVVVFAYNRVDHIREVLNALDQNLDVEKTDLYIFADGAKDESEIINVRQVREYIHLFRENTRFLNVEIHEAGKNKGLAKSIIEGVTKIINRYGKVIVLEDDHVTSRDFIRFMNEGLDFYENNPRIWSISGYTWEMKRFNSYSHDIFMGYRASCWGWASWKNRWDMVDWEVGDYAVFMKDASQRRAFNRGGLDMTPLLRMNHEGKINSWAIRWCYQQYKEGMLSVFPVHSKVRNIGFDGSGMHSGKVSAFKTDLYQDERIRFENIPTDRLINFEFWLYYSKLYLRQQIGKYWYLMTEYEYCILYNWGKKGGDIRKLEFSSLKPTYRFWYADPVPFSDKGREYIFMEVYDKLRKKGFIGVSHFDKNGKLSKPVKVIEENFHMSFPHIFRYGSDVFMIPECSESGQLRIYKMGQDVLQWTLYSVFDNMEGLVDTVSYCQKHGAIYLISSQENPENKYQTRLVLLKLSNLQDKDARELKEVWRAPDYSYDVRNAGELLKIGDTVNRVIQHSTEKEYGKYITISRLANLGENGIQESTCKKIGIGDLKFSLTPFIYRAWGTHTYGETDQVVALDLSVQRFSIGGIFYKICRRIKV